MPAPRYARNLVGKYVPTHGAEKPALRRVRPVKNRAHGKSPTMFLDALLLSN